MITIGCDGRALIGPRTGVGTWTLQVMAGLARYPDNRLVLAAHRQFEIPPELSRLDTELLDTGPLRLPGTLWLHSALQSRLSAAMVQVFIATLAIAPRRCPVPLVTMVHDLTPRTHPRRHTLANRFCFNAYFAESLEQSQAVVVGSRATEKVLLEHFSWVAPRLHRIGYGVDEFYSADSDPEERQRIRSRFSAGRPYLLHLGTLEPRKGVDTLITAWEKLRSELPTAPDLVLAGAPGWHMGPLNKIMERSSQRAHLHRAGYVNREDARGLLRHATAFVLASEAEGFGLPLAEALSCGTPSVAADIPALREVADRAALFVPPRDPKALAEALTRILDGETAQTLREAGLARAPQLRWQPVIAAWQTLLHNVVSSAARAG